MDEVRLIHVARTPDGYHVDKSICRPLPNGAQEAAILQQVRELGPGPLDGPLAACIDDSLAMLRTLTLPAAGADATEKMVRSQVEALLPAHDGRFTCGWCSQDHPSRAGMRQVTVCVIGNETVRLATQACAALGTTLSAVMTRSMALAGGLARLGGPAAQDTAIMAVARRGTTLTFLHQGKVLHGGFIDRGIEPPGSPAEPQADPSQQAAQWGQQLHEVYHIAMAECGARPPARAILIGDPAKVEDFKKLAASALGLAVQDAACPALLALAADIEFVPASAAIGAALCQIEPLPTSCRIAVRTPTARSATGARPMRRWAIAASWLLAAIILLYGLDVYEAHRLSSSAASIRRGIGQDDSSERQAAVSKYLDQGGATPLAVLDELSTVLPPQALLTSFRYYRGGEVTVAGTLSGEQELHALLKKLAESPLSSGVTFQDAKNVQGKLRFDLSFKIGAERTATSRPAGSGAASPTSSTSAGNAPAGGAK